MRQITFTIDGPPEGKRRPRSSTRHGIARIHSDPADVKREKAVALIVREAMKRAPIFRGAVRVEIEAIFEVAPSWPKKRKAEALENVYHTSKPDADNIEKSVLDSMVAAKGDDPFCLVDDAQVAEIMTRKRYGSPARTEVRVSELMAGLL